MIALHLPSGWAEHMTVDVGALRWLSLPGEWPKACPHPDPTECSGEHCDCPLSPPAFLVAALGECEWCHGAGRSLFADVDCSGCAGTGRPLVEVTVPCDCTHLLHDDPPYGWECPDCVCDDARLSLGRWVATGESRRDDNGEFAIEMRRVQ